jgi:hypothetical protein
MPDQGKEDDDWNRHAEQPKQNPATHDCFLRISYLGVGPPNRSAGRRGRGTCHLQNFADATSFRAAASLPGDASRQSGVREEPRMVFALKPGSSIYATLIPAGPLSGEKPYGIFGAGNARLSCEA